MSDYKVGQELWWEPSEPRRACMVTIRKVGRIWLELSNGRRVDKLRLVEDCKVGSAARCYLDRDARNADLTADALWTALRAKIYLRQKTVSADDIHAAAKLLGVAL